MRHCWCLCEQLQVLTASDRALIYIIGGLVINGNGVWEDPIKIWREIWSHATALCFLSPAVLAIIRILLIKSAFLGEMPNFGAACRQDLAEFVPKRTSESLPDSFTILPERGSMKSGSCSTSDTDVRGYPIIYCHLKVISVSRLKYTSLILICKRLIMGTKKELNKCMIKKMWFDSWVLHFKCIKSIIYS